LWIGLIKPIPKDAKICECKLYKRDNTWYLDVAVQRDIPEKTEYQNVIAIDMGIKHIATSVELATNTSQPFLLNVGSPIAPICQKIKEDLLSNFRFRWLQT